MWFLTFDFQESLLTSVIDSIQLELLHKYNYTS